MSAYATLPTDLKAGAIKAAYDAAVKVRPDGNPGTGGTYRYWDQVTLKPPSGAKRATIDRLYQPTSWEYIQFLYLANRRSSPCP